MGLEILGAAGPTAASSAADWWQAAWPIVRGCSPVSAGCDHCTAAATAQKAYPQYLSGDHWSGRVDVIPALLDAPRRIQRPLRWLASPSSDIFHPRVPDAFLEDACAAMEAAPWHTFALLTKRPARARRFFARRRVPANAWMGVSVELADQVWRVAELAKIASSLHWVSAEPILGPLAPALEPYLRNPVMFVAAGPEVGPDRRPCDPQWMRDLAQSCQAAGVPFFTKHILDGRALREVP